MAHSFLCYEIMIVDAMINNDFSPMLSACYYAEVRLLVDMDITKTKCFYETDSLKMCINTNISFKYRIARKEL